MGVNVENKQQQIFVADKKMVLQLGGWAGDKNPHMALTLHVAKYHRLSQTSVSSFV